MRIDRRSGLLKILASVGTAALAPWRRAFAENVQYSYDALGRLVGVTYDNGASITYTYDATGNRTQIVQSPGSFSGTIPITGSGPVNLRTLANANGYNGAQSATITFTIASGVTLAGNGGASDGGAGGICVDTGAWPGGFTIALTLNNAGVIRGGGGGGGAGAGTGSGHAGGAGGDAIYAQFDLTLTNSGTIQGGGGGGGGGGGWKYQELDPPELSFWNGGGGGGGFPNGSYGPEGSGSGVTDVSNNGANGTASGGGSGGSGGSIGGGSRVTATGGAGGGAAATGTTGGTSSGGASGGYLKTSGGAGGAAGYAVRKNGHTVSVTNTGTITGTQA